MAKTPGENIKPLIAFGTGGEGNAPFEELIGDSAPGPTRAGEAFRGPLLEKLLERVIAKRDFLPSSFLEAGATAARAVGRLVIRRGVDYEGNSWEEGWTGTGFLVAPGVLLTNHHVLNSIDVCRETVLQLNYRNKLDGSADRHEEFLLEPDRLFVTSGVADGLDFTFVGVARASDPFGFVALNRRAYVTRDNMYANIIQHPDGRYQEIVIHDSEVVADHGTLLHYRTDTEPGSSGAPAFDNAWRCIGLHHASVPDPAKPSQYLNEGIKLSSIAADLESRLDPGNPANHAALALKAFDGINSALGYFGTLGREAKLNSTGLEALVDKYKGDDQDIDIGAWNIEWFSNRFEAKLDRVAKIIAEFNLDIWALIESSPEAANQLVAKLKDDFDLDYAAAHSEPNAGTGKQSTSMIWNTKAVDGQAVEWDAEVKPWFDVDSRAFDDSLLEAVHGKIFNRYPGLFRFKAKSQGHDFDFFAVPLHLKAMAEGSLRRGMASKILAAAMNKMIDKGHDGDWVLLGDMNAELASQDFAPLTARGLVAISAQDEADQSFTYLKAPHKSMIDHVFLSPNLATRFGGESFFTVAADKTFPNFIAEVSDHRPIVTRLSLAPPPPSAAAAVPQSLRDELARHFPAFA